LTLTKILKYAIFGTQATLDFAPRDLTLPFAEKPMRSLTLDDLMPLEEYASRRREFHDTLQRYLDRYRRVRVGPRATLVFENRQTLWYRIHEVMRIARLAEPRLVQRELDLFNRLLPDQGSLQAALLLHVKEDGDWHQEMACWQNLQGDHVRLQLGALRVCAHLVTSRPEDRCIGTAHWVQFHLDLSGRRALGDFRKSAFFEIGLEDYHHASPFLSDDLRQSLLEDLIMSDRDSA
jgi:hypothetical protein